METVGAGEPVYGGGSAITSAGSDGGGVLLLVRLSGWRCGKGGARPVTKYLA
jgi:hypothetical protein